MADTVELNFSLVFAARALFDVPQLGTMTNAELHSDKYSLEGWCFLAPCDVQAGDFIVLFEAVGIAATQFMTIVLRPTEHGLVQVK